VLEFSIDNDFVPKSIHLEDLPRLRKSYLDQARQISSELEKQGKRPYVQDEKNIEELKSFYYIHRA
jgi:hypothetical protein